MLPLFLFFIVATLFCAPFLRLSPTYPAFCLSHASFTLIAHLPMFFSLLYFFAASFSRPLFRFVFSYLFYTILRRPYPFASFCPGRLFCYFSFFLFFSSYSSFGRFASSGSLSAVAGADSTVCPRPFCWALSLAPSLPLVPSHCSPAPE